MENSWKRATEKAATAIFQCFSSILQITGGEVLGQQNVECGRFLTDFRKGFIVMSDIEYTNLGIAEVLVFKNMFAEL